MLELLTFDVVLESPYTHLFHVLRQLALDDNKDLRNVAWAFVNDSQMTTAALRMGARDVAVAAVYFAARYTHAQIPDAAPAVPWWRAVGGDDLNIVKAVTILQEFYLENPLGRADNPHEGSPGGSIEDLEATRAPSPGPNEGGATGGTAGRGREQEQEQEGAAGAEAEAGLAAEAEPRESIEMEDLESAGATRGDDDAVLKLAANDPATHEALGDAEAGVPGGVVAGEGVGEGGAKRRGDEGAQEGREAKRAKGEESEEGEVEE